MKQALAIILFLSVTTGVAQKINIEKNLREQWLVYSDNTYQRASEIVSGKYNTIYLDISYQEVVGRFISIASDQPYFIFVNGKLSGEFRGRYLINADSVAALNLASGFLIGIHQKRLNERNLKTEIVARSLHLHAGKVNDIIHVDRPVTWFRDFVISAGLFLIILFLVITRLNPKLASDYFSIDRIFSLREVDDGQSNARLTSSTNIQFYVSCSLLLGFYMMVLLRHLPAEYSLPVHFNSHSYWSTVWQWVRLSAIILFIFIGKIILIFSLTRLFSMRGMSRIHFFNWVRLLIIVFGACTVIVFVYFISRGQRPGFFVAFLSLVSVTLAGWVVLAFLKLNGKTGHSMFHLFSYICATEIIPLLITVKVLFQ